MSFWTEVNGTLAIVGGVSGFGVLVYLGVMLYYARKKDRHITNVEIRLARIEGILLGRLKR